MGSAGFPEERECAKSIPSAITSKCPVTISRWTPTFLTFKGKRGEKIRRFQYTAIDDGTRVRALKIYEKHTQANAIDFVNHIIEKFPFRIREIRTDNGHEFQAKFHWHVEDLGIRHAYIRKGTPQLNGKVERSHRSDQQEFY
jgi:transposase InsO family protein